MAVKNTNLGGTDWVDGEVLYAADLKSTIDALQFQKNETTIQAGLNTIRSLFDASITFSKGGVDGFADAYVDSGGRMNSVTQGTGIFDSDKYKTAAGLYADIHSYVIIEATSLNTVLWNANNCYCIQIDNGKWLVFSTSNDTEVERAEVYMSLFYGTTGADQLIDDFTGVTAVKTNTVRDVSKRWTYVRVYGAKTNSAESPHSVNYTGTFDDTSNNDDCSSWSNVIESSWSGDWDMPAGISLNGGGLEMGTDRTADEQNNPADCRIDFNAGGYGSCESEAIIAHFGSITWVKTGTWGTSSLIDFFTDDSIPIMTLAGSLAAESAKVTVIYHTIPAGTFSDTISKGIAVPFIADWETGADIDFKFINATEDSGWLNALGNMETNVFTPFTSEPTAFLVRLIPKTTSPTAGYPSIFGFWVKGWTKYS